MISCRLSRLFRFYSAMLALDSAAWLNDTRIPLSAACFGYVVTWQWAPGNPNAKR
ncbi:hypothetical protein BDP27DRAFT_1337173 [Rhodocollybia butyracea]|uniref:Uncharacterized protein n=1 Tax=Rhodocollybia butyracea TaxID=206335 RepID=A0A9P5PAN6_9AGAR|nr:hypothetical protein BDP27DRAFT_1337173 [Rhodocollybia butyracea]